MEILDFTQYALWLNALVFAASAAVVWLAGTRISRYANTISERTGIGKALLGLLLLGGVTSLPEVAVTVSSSLAGNAALAVNNLLGGVAMQVVILAAADAFLGRDALSSVIPKPVVLLQATFNVLLLTLVIAGISVGEASLGFNLDTMVSVQVGAWTTIVLAMGLAAIWLIQRYERSPAWTPDGREEPQRTNSEHHRNPPPRQEDGSGEGENRRNKEAREESGGLRGVLLHTALAAAAILFAGFFLSRTGESIAQQTGLGSSFVGAVFVGFSTSLPEVSTVLSAMRLRRYEMAVSDIFGTNIFDLLLVFVVDAVYSGGPVLDEVGVFSIFAALLGIALTTIYLAGLIERRDRTVLRMGWDSLAVLVIYLAGLVVLYQLR